MSHVMSGQIMNSKTKTKKKNSLSNSYNKLVRFNSNSKKL